MGIVKMAARVIKANISSIVWLYLLSAVLLFYVSIEPPAKPGPAITSQHYSVNTERLLDPRNFVSIVWESREAAESRDLVRAAGSASRARLCSFSATTLRINSSRTVT